MLLDYSKNLVTADIIEKIIALAKECDIESWRSKMFSGENITEHVELSLIKIKNFTESIRQGKWKGYSGKGITDVVNIGVGGSMVTEAIQ